MPTYPSLHAPAARALHSAPSAPPASLPPPDELTARGIVFERVHPAHEQPVRLRQHGHALGIWPSPAAAASVIKSLSLLLVMLLALQEVPVMAAGEGPFSPAAFLGAVAEVEDWRGQRGAAGEIGPWQMMPRTWASYRGTAEDRARAHLAWLRATLERRGVEPSPFNLALCWNAGLHATLTGRAPVASYDYARRVVALMETPAR
jgi:hypothetical protein